MFMQKRPSRKGLMRPFGCSSYNSGCLCNGHGRWPKPNNGFVLVLVLLSVAGSISGIVLPGTVAPPLLITLTKALG
jgi:hypothetical protein